VQGLLTDCETKLAAVLVAREGAAGQWEAAARYLYAMRARCTLVMYRMANKRPRVYRLVEQLLTIASPDEGDSSLRGCLLRMHSFITESKCMPRKSVVQQGRHFIAGDTAIETYNDDDKILRSVLDNIVEAVVAATN
jgi:signal transduction histidine kinase